MPSCTVVTLLCLLHLFGELDMHRICLFAMTCVASALVFGGVAGCSNCATDAECSDGRFCNGAETCADGLCLPGTSPCDEGEWCDEQDNSCYLLCETGDDCGEAEICDLEAQVCIVCIECDNDVGCYEPGVPLTRTFTITPPFGTLVYGVEDSPPSGWSVSSISDLGEWDGVHGKVKWYFLHDESRPLSYEATPPSSGSGRACFSGEASFDGDVTQGLEDACMTQCGI